MKTKTLLFVLLVAIALPALSQVQLGGRLAAMGQSGVAVKDNWSLALNPAGITGSTAPTAGLSFTKYYFADELSEQSGVVTVPLGNYYLGAGFNRYGISEFNQIRSSLGFAKKFGDKLAIGISGSFHQLKITGYGASTAFSFDVGALYNITPELILAASISNPAQQNYTTDQVILKVPSVFRLGVGYQITSKVLVATAVNKDFDEKLDVSLGMDYQLIELLSLRGGISAKPFTQYVGFGIHYKKLLADFALQNHPNLGYVPQIALGYAF